MNSLYDICMSYIYSIEISQCVPETHFEDTLYQGSPPTAEATFDYQIDLYFDSAEALAAFEAHPQRQEIVGTLKQSTIENGRETLILEQLRDRLSEIYPNADKESFNDNTIIDFATTLAPLINIINEQYGSNIRQGNIAEAAIETEGPTACSLLSENEVTPQLPAAPSIMKT